MQLREISAGKQDYLPLLLVGDEQEEMIDRYLDRGTLLVLEDGGVKALCVVTDEGNGTLELKNLAVDPRFQHQGYGRAVIALLVQRYRGAYRTLLAGTGDSPLTLPFYLACGFQRSHVIPNFFIDHYDHPIFECGRQLVDMIYLKREL